MLESNNNRLKFVFALTPLAAIYGALLSFRLLGWQADIVSDVVKMSMMIFILTALVSFVLWSLIRPRVSGILGGALAGGLTALILIPLPTLLGGFKSNFFTQSNGFAAALSEAAAYSLSTFSAAEFVAIPLSMAVGIWASLAPQGNES